MLFLTQSSSNTNLLTTGINATDLNSILVKSSSKSHKWINLGYWTNHGGYCHISAAEGDLKKTHWLPLGFKLRCSCDSSCISSFSFTSSSACQKESHPLPSLIPPPHCPFSSDATSMCVVSQQTRAWMTTGRHNIFLQQQLREFVQPQPVYLSTEM